MEKKEILAANLEEATAKASEAFGVPADQIKVTVLEETKGLFGKPGKIKVLAEAKPAKASKAKEKKAAEPAPVTAVVEVAAEPEAAPAPAKEAKPRGKGKPKADAPAEAGATETEKPAKEDAPEVVATEEDAKALAGILISLLDKAGLEVEVKVASVNGRYVNIDLDGSDVGFLVGRRGEVLNALQYLLNVISSRRVTQGVRVTLEGDDYRKRRETILTQMAIEVAEEVKKRGEEALLDALPAFERRIIHQALVDFEGVETYSEGEEPNRCVVIAPA